MNMSEGDFMNDYLFVFQENEAKYKQIYRKLKKLIEEGIIIKDEELPSIRKLAESLKVSRNTTLSAYEQLVAEGYIRGKAKSAFYVNAIEPNLLVENGKVSVEENGEKINVLVDFRTGAVDQLFFPLSTWRKYSNDVLKVSKTYTYGVEQGEERLRLQLKAYLLSSRGFKASICNMVIGSSTQQLLCQSLSYDPVFYKRYSK